MPKVKHSRPNRWEKQCDGMKHKPGSFRDLVESSEFFAAYNYRIKQIMQYGSKTKVSLDKEGNVLVTGAVAEAVKEREECRI